MGVNEPTERELRPYIEAAVEEVASVLRLLERSCNGRPAALQTAHVPVTVAQEVAATTAAAAGELTQGF
jgi:hypothetical protein